MQFHRYEVIEKLDDGKFASVFRCRDHDLDRRTVVKRFNVDCRVGDYPPEFWRARFLMEARAMARIEHEYVAPVLVFSRTTAGTPYLALPWYPDSLKARLGSDRSSPEAIATMRRRRRPRRLERREAVRIARQLLQGLGAVHAAGIVHRDIKPANIMLSEKADRMKPGYGTGDVRIVDFGLCRHPDLRLTRASGWLGTEAYMSPEQWDSTANACHRTDLYAVGVIFYRMLFGALPVGRPATVDAAMDAPKAIADWLAHMLAPKPEDRPDTAMVALDLLAEALDDAGGFA